MTLDWLPKSVLEAVDSLDLSLNVEAVPEIETLLGKTVLFRGKKFRPTLSFLVGQFFRLDLKQVSPYARAAEFVHSATLAHDDVIDESAVRRNRPTLNARSTNGRAVLAGDLLLARVMVELSALGQLRVIHDLSKTVEELVQGEWLQLEARKIVSITRQHLETVARKKTASLMSWCCIAPARLAGQSEEMVQASGRLGEAMGVAFQMIDDIIDYSQSGEKPFAQDLREGLVNFVTLEMLENNPSLKYPIQRLLSMPDGSGDESGESSKDLKPSGASKSSATAWPWQSYELASACDRVRARSQAKLELADQTLSQMANSFSNPDPEAMQALRSILLYLRERVR